MCVVKVLWSTYFRGFFLLGRFLSGRAFRCKSSLGCGLYPAIPNAVCANAISLTVSCVEDFYKFLSFILFLT